MPRMVTFPRALTQTLFVVVYLTLAELLCQCLTSESCRWKTHEEFGDVNFGVILSMRSSTPGGTCGEVGYGALQQFLAVKYAVQKLNSPGRTDNQTFIPGVKIGFTAFDDCGNEKIAAASVTSMVQQLMPSEVIDCDRHTIPLVAGFIGSTRAQSTVAMSHLLEGLGIPLVGVGPTFSKISNKAQYPDVLRTAVSNEEHSKAVISLVKKLNWTVIVVVHADDDFSKDMSESVRRLAKESHVCVVYRVGIANQRDAKKLLTRLRKMQTDTAHVSLGVVFVGQPPSVRHLVDELRDEYQENSRSDDSLQWLLSDSVGTHAGLLNDILESSRPFLRNVWSVSRSSIVIQEFSEFVKSEIQGNASTLWTEEFVQSSCSPPFLRPGCIEFKQDNFVTSVINAIYSLAMGLRQMQRRLCGEAGGLCHLFRAETTSGLLSVVRNGSVKYADIDVNHTIPEFAQENTTVSFDENGDMLRNADEEIYNINTFKGNKFVKVGSYYQNGFLEARPTEMPPSVCSGMCPECVVPPSFVYFPGEILLAGFFSLHWAPGADDPFGCGKYKTEFYSTVAVEAVLYTVKKMRDETGENFGVIIFDDCYNSLAASSILSKFFSRKTPLVDPVSGEAIDLQKVVAVIGSESSTVTLSLAESFVHLRLPIISPSSTTPDLDDKGLYPFSLRTCPSDKISAEVIVKILKEFDWKYVNIIYINNNYGYKGMLYVRNKAEEEGICVAEPIAMAANPEKRDLACIIRKLNANRARVVVYVGLDQDMAAFENTLKYHEMDLVFVALGDCFTFKPPSGALVVLPEQPLLPWDDFPQYLQNRTPMLTETSLWFDRLWQRHFQCNLPGRFESSYEQRCSSELKFDKSTSNRWARHFMVVNTINAVASALKGCVKAHKFFCQRESKFKCLTFELHPSNVTQFINTIHLDSTTGQSYRPYRDNGNGNIEFGVYSLKHPTDGSATYEKFAVYHSMTNELVPVIDKTALFYEKGKSVLDIKAVCTVEEICRSCGRGIRVTAPVSQSSPPENSSTQVAILALVSALATVVVVYVVVRIIVRARTPSSPNQAIRKVDNVLPTEPSMSDTNRQPIYENPSDASSSCVSQITEPRARVPATEGGVRRSGASSEIACVSDVVNIILRDDDDINTNSVVADTISLRDDDHTRLKTVDTDTKFFGSNHTKVKTVDSTHNPLSMITIPS